MEDATREEVAVFAKQAGLNLPEPYFEELLSAYRHLQRMTARISHGRPRSDEPAHVFVAATFAREG
jgi:hypothetical protein